MQMQAQRQPGVTTFFRLWFVLGLSYFFINLALDLLVYGYIDLRPRALWELIFLPLGQSAAFWWVTRRGRVRDAQGGAVVVESRVEEESLR